MCLCGVCIHEHGSANVFLSICVFAQGTENRHGCQGGWPYISALRYLGSMAMGTTTRREGGRRRLSWRPGAGLEEAGIVCLGLLTRVIAHVSIHC